MLSNLEEDGRVLLSIKLRLFPTSMDNASDALWVSCRMQKCSFIYPPSVEIQRPSAENAVSTAQENEPSHVIQPGANEVSVETRYDSRGTNTHRPLRNAFDLLPHELLELVRALSIGSRLIVV